MIWLLVFVIIIALILEIPPLIKEKKFKEIGVFLVLITLGFYLGIVQIYDLPFTNPLLKGL